MSRTVEFKGTLVGAAAVAIAAGFVTALTPGVTAPARAGLGCVEWGFPAANTVLASGNLRLIGETSPPNDDWSLNWSNDRSGQTLSATSATLTGFRDKAPITGSVSATIAGGARQQINLNYDSPEASFTLNGDVSNEGNVINSSASGGKVTWRFATPLVCNKMGDVPGAQGPVQGPDVKGEPILGGLIVHVTDHSGKTSKCHYDSEVVDRDFTLNANSTADLTIVPALPLGRAWPVTVTCDNGAKTETTIDF